MTQKKQYKFVIWFTNVKFAPKLRGGAVVARWAHNPKVGGSNPPSATKKKPCRVSGGVFYLQPESQTQFADEGMEIKNNDSRRRRLTGVFLC